MAAQAVGLLAWKPEKLEVCLQLPREVRCIRLAVVVEG